MSAARAKTSAPPASGRRQRTAPALADASTPPASARGPIHGEHAGTPARIDVHGGGMRHAEAEALTLRSPELLCSTDGMTLGELLRASFNRGDDDEDFGEAALGAIASELKALYQGARRGDIGSAGVDTLSALARRAEVAREVSRRMRRAKGGA